MAVPTLTVRPDANRRRCFIVVSADVGSSLTLYRISAQGRYPVRGVVEYVTSLEETIFTDYELPQNTELSYMVVAELNGTQQASATITVGSFDFGGDVIFDLGKPWAGLVVNVESFPTQNYDIARDVANVWDRPDPVVVSGERQLPSGTLNLLTLSVGERGALKDTLFTGNIVAFSPAHPAYGVDSPSYFSVGKVTEERTSPLALEESRRWALEVQQVEPPRSSYLYPAGNISWQQVYDAGPWSVQLTKRWFEVAGF
jgi:hypothetical protein